MSSIRKMPIFALLSAMLVFIGVVGCQSDYGPTERFDFAELNTDTFAVVDYYDADANINDATIESDLSMNPVFNSNGKFHRHGRYRGGRGGHLGKILRQIGITEEQGAAIKELIKAHRESVKASFEALREANQAILDDAKAERKAILEALRNGDITRDEAKEQLKALSESKREAIANNPESAQHVEAICNAKKSLFDNIRALLDESQQAAWDEWVAGLNGQCLGSEG